VTARVDPSARNDGLTIVCISDTHELHGELAVPNGDILIHGGDFTFFGKSARAVRDFNAWLGELPHRHKVAVPGNHEFILESNPQFANLITNATVLNNESTTIEGLRIWGSPLTQHDGGAFGRSDALDRIRVYNTIPQGTDIVITHGPPYGILDASPGDHPGPTGDKELREAIVRIRPRLHVFGHMHSGYGIRPTRNTLFINAALFGLDGTLSNRPIVVRLSVQKPHR
jgi:Icc-related predicted phosphoesterase